MNFKWSLFKLALFISLFYGANTYSQTRPKMGLTLSGGGAKGLAHVGILKAIDSAGLKIDYLTGTSMGAIIGSLYAIGYSGKEIEKIARSIDWGLVLANRPPVGLVNMNEKKEFSNYVVEVPIEKGKAKVYTGLIEAEEIWLKFGELFFPVYNKKDFSQFSIPFECVATDVETGKEVALKDGEIVKAIRASMAIPSIFSSIPYKNTKLIDGGVVRNFPVRNVKAMGADLVIGVNLSQGLLSADKLNSPIDVLYQIGFYKDADDIQQEKKLCNLLIQPPLSGFSAASFGASDSLLAIGIAEGKKYYPYFKKLADSLKALYPETVAEVNRLPKPAKIQVDEVIVTGLKSTSKQAFEDYLGLEKGKSYNGKDLSNAMRYAFGTNDFRRIAYFIKPQQPGHATLHCEVIENPKTFVKAGIHYNGYSNIALITTLATNDLIFKGSKSLVKINWSENGRALIRHNQTMGRNKKRGIIISGYSERFNFPIYQNFDQIGLYRSIYSYLDLRFYRIIKTRDMIGVGSAVEWLTLKPSLSPDFTVKGKNHYQHTYFYYQHNSLDQKYFPHRGAYRDIEFGIIYSQHHNVSFTTVGSLITLDSIQSLQNATFSAYQQLKAKLGRYFPIGERWTIIGQINSGINFNYQRSFINFFSVGGINDFIRNQITFVGLTENQILTNSIVSSLVGLQFEPAPSIFTTLRANAAVYDFIDKKPEQLTRSNLLRGYAASVGYRSAIGPIELSLMYSDQTRSYKGYVNIGFTF